MGAIEVIQELTLVEIARLGELEQVVETGLTVFVKVGNALLEIRDSRLYRQQFPTFEAYCRERWGLKQSRAYQLLDAAVVVGNLQSSTIVELPKTESQARPLTRLEPEVQREVWQDVVASTPADQITARVVEEKAQAAEPLNEAVKTIKEELKTVSLTSAQQSIIPQPIKPENPLIAAVTARVISGELSVIEAAKEIKAATSTGDFHVSQGNNDWYTPAEYIEAARQVMGGIDLDPASSDIAQETVKAGTYFTAETNSLDKPWHGRVWLNPPFSMPLIQQFVDKLLAEWTAGRVSQATVITNNATDTGWFQKLLVESKLACLTKGRVRFYSPVNDGLAPRQGQAFFYLGHQSDRFVETFREFGAVVRVRP